MSYNSKYTGAEAEALLGKADTALQEHQDISGKQDKLVSGTNIKTINGTSLLGSGDITIEGGGEEVYIGGTEPADESIELWIDESTESDDSGNTLIIDTEMSDTSTNAVQNMVIKAYVDGLVGDIATAIDLINGEEV